METPANGQVCSIRLTRNLVPSHLLALLITTVFSHVCMVESSFLAQLSLLDKEKQKRNGEQVLSFKGMALKLILSLPFPWN